MTVVHLLHNSHHLLLESIPRATTSKPLNIYKFIFAVLVLRLSNINDCLLCLTCPQSFERVGKFLACIIELYGI